MVFGQGTDFSLDVQPYTEYPTQEEMVAEGGAAGAGVDLSFIGDLLGPEEALVEKAVLVEINPTGGVTPIGTDHAAMTRLAISDQFPSRFGTTKRLKRSSLTRSATAPPTRSPTPAPRTVSGSIYDDDYIHATTGSTYGEEILQEQLFKDLAVSPDETIQPTSATTTVTEPKKKNEVLDASTYAGDTEAVTDLSPWKVSLNPSGLRHMLPSRPRNIEKRVLDRVKAAAEAVPASAASLVREAEKGTSFGVHLPTDPGPGPWDFYGKKHTPLSGEKLRKAGTFINKHLKQGFSDKVGSVIDRRNRTRNNKGLRRKAKDALKSPYNLKGAIKSTITMPQTSFAKSQESKLLELSAANRAVNPMFPREGGTVSPGRAKYRPDGSPIPRGESDDVPLIIGLQILDKIKDSDQAINTPEAQLKLFQEFLKEVNQRPGEHGMISEASPELAQIWEDALAINEHETSKGLSTAPDSGSQFLENLTSKYPNLKWNDGKVVRSSGLTLNVPANLPLHLQGDTSTHSEPIEFQVPGSDTTQTAFRASVGGGSRKLRRKRTTKKRKYTKKRKNNIR